MRTTPTQEPRFEAVKEPVVFEGKMQRHRWMVRDNRTGRIEDMPDGKRQAERYARDRNRASDATDDQYHVFATYARFPSASERACPGCHVVGAGTEIADHRPGCAYQRRPR